MEAPKMQNMDAASYGRKDCGEQRERQCRHGEDTPAYQVLKASGMLDSTFRLETSGQIDAVPSNATRWANLWCNIFCCPCWTCGCLKTFEVNQGEVRLVEDGRGRFLFYGNGVHRIFDMFYKVRKGGVAYQQGVINHGDITICVVQQGQVGFVLEKGQPILLPPGMHQWRSTTMVFQKSFDLNNNVLRMGPLTLVTVDSGYSAVTEDNGLQRVLKGGQTYLLTHRNWKFEKFISEKIQTNAMKRIEATSADNVLMAVDSSVIWRITDVESAALNAGETIAKDGAENKQGDMGNIAKLTNDVLKQAEASLAAFIGAVNYSDTFNVAAAMQRGDIMIPRSDSQVVVGRAPSAPVPAKAPASSPLFDLQRMQTCLDHANSVTATYGVTILSINVVAAVPADQKLMVSLAQGAVAAAEAQKFETVATGRAAAAKIEAKGIAEAEVIRAKGDAEAETLRAHGAKAAADLISRSTVATQLAMIDRTGHALGDNKAFFFGADPKKTGELLASAPEHQTVISF